MLLALRMAVKKSTKSDAAEPEKRKKAHLAVGVAAVVDKPGKVAGGGGVNVVAAVQLHAVVVVVLALGLAQLLAGSVNLGGDDCVTNQSVSCARAEMI